MDLPSDIPYTEQFAEIGIETGYILSNCFSQIVIVICGTFYFIFQKCKSQKKCNKRKKQRKLARKKLKKSFDYYIRIIIEVSLDIALIGLIEILMKIHNTVWEKISFFTSVILLRVLFGLVITAYELVTT